MASKGRHSIYSSCNLCMADVLVLMHGAYYTHTTMNNKNKGRLGGVLGGVNGTRVMPPVNLDPRRHNMYSILRVECYLRLNISLMIEVNCRSLNKKPDDKRRTLVTLQYAFIILCSWLTNDPELNSTSKQS